jgi:hypothetical protein
VDDAALFPPSETTMADAVRGHLAGRAGERAGMVGLFLCPASRLPELITELVRAKPAKPLPLSLVVDTGLGGVPKAVSIVESRTELLALRMVEMPAPSDVDEVWLERVAEFVPEDVVRVVEPRHGGNGWLEGVARVAERGYWPKLRCGGRVSEAFPSADEVADFLSVLIESGTSFKTTSGLPGAVRHTADTGVTHHGFVNLLVATSRALAGKDVRLAVRKALTSEDGPALASEAAALSDDAARAVRAVFASYGSYTLAEPVSDLEDLGLL